MWTNAYCYKEEQFMPYIQMILYLLVLTRVKKTGLFNKYGIQDKTSQMKAISKIS